MLTLILRSLRIKKNRDFKLGCSKAFYNRLPRILKAIKAQKRRAFDNSRKIWENLPTVSTESAFSQIGRKQSSLDSKLESGQTISFIFEETDISSFLNAYAETEMHHYLSLFTHEFDAGAK